MAKPFAEYDYDDAVELFGRKAIAGATTLTSDLTLRRPLTAISASDFFKGDFWQSGKGFIGQLPPASFPGAAQITADIKKRFEGENVIKQIVETHLGGILGREPLWGFLKEVSTDTQKKEKDDATGDMLTPWWNERKALADLQKSAETTVLEGRAIKRLFFPKGILPEDRVLAAPDVNQALDYLFFETLNADVAGVFTDADTQKQIGVYLFEEKNDEGDVVDNCAELSFVDEEGETVCKVVKDKGNPEEFGPYKLGGQLLLHEIQRSPLITEEVQTNQKALNLAHTMMTRNVNLAGARERTVANAQPPKKPIRRQDPNNPGRTTEELQAGTHETGGGAVMYLMGYPIYDKDNNVVGYTNPNMTITDPASVDVFVNTRRMKYEAMLAQCHQLHLLIAGDATASGVSRKQAEKAFQRSLKETKTVIDAAGRWLLETSLRLAAQISGQSEKYLNLRADFNCLLDIGEPDPDDRRVAVEMRDARLISSETARGWIGIDDAEAEKKRIEEEQKTEDQNALQKPLTNVRQLGQTATPALRSLFGQPNPKLPA